MYARGSEGWLRHIATELNQRQLLGMELQDSRSAVEPAVVAFIVPVEWGRLTYPIEIEGLLGYYGVRTWVRGNHRTVMAVAFYFYPPEDTPSVELLQKVASEFGLTAGETGPSSKKYFGVYSPNL